jgi:hypothetical protein
MSFRDIILGLLIIIALWTAVGVLLLNERRVYRMMGALLGVVVVLMSFVVFAG